MAPPLPFTREIQSQFSNLALAAVGVWDAYQQLKMGFSTDSPISLHSKKYYSDINNTTFAIAKNVLKLNTMTETERKMYVYAHVYVQMYKSMCFIYIYI